MEIDHLKSFASIAQEKSFSRAAQKQYISQPAISMQMKALEEEVGQALFDRGKREVQLTEAGKIVHSHAKAIFNEIKCTHDEIDAIQKLVRGHLVIGCSDTISSYLLPSVLSEFLAKYPAIEVALHNRHTPEIIRMVLDREVDCGIVTLPVGENDCEVQRLFSYKNVALCTGEHICTQNGTITVQALAQHRLLLLEQGTQNRLLVDEAFKDAQVRHTSVMEFGSVEVQKAFAKAGLGIAIIPDFALPKKKRLRNMRTLRIRKIKKCEVGIVVRKNRILSPATQEFITLLKSQQQVLL